MLTVRDHMRLTLADENRGPWLNRAGRIRWELGESETAFALRVHQLLEDPDAAAEKPMEVARLRRMRDARREARSALRSKPAEV